LEVFVLPHIYYGADLLWAGLQGRIDIKGLNDQGMKVFVSKLNDQGLVLFTTVLHQVLMLSVLDFVHQ